MCVDDFPPGGSEWIISVGDYVDNSFTALGSSDPREVRAQALARLLCFFHFRFVQVHFFLLTVFHDAFSISCKILSYYVY